MNIFDVLFCIFVVLKLTSNIDWSWWIIMIPFALSLIVFIINHFTKRKTKWVDKQ